MLGLAYMACHLAEHRVGSHALFARDFFNPDVPAEDKGPLNREIAAHGYLVSGEYYAIIDRITHGEKP